MYMHHGLLYVPSQFLVLAQPGPLAYFFLSQPPTTLLPCSLSRRPFTLLRQLQQQRILEVLVDRHLQGGQGTAGARLSAGSQGHQERMARPQAQGKQRSNTEEGTVERPPLRRRGARQQGRPRCSYAPGHCALASCPAQPCSAYSRRRSCPCAAAS